MTDGVVSGVRPAQVLLPVGLGTALSLIGDATLYTVLPTHTADAGITLASVGIMLGVNRAVRLFLNGPAGLAYERWSRRALFTAALVVGALSTAMYAGTRGFWPLLVARMLWGLAWSGIWVGGTAMILDVASPQERGRWVGLYQTWFFLGAAFGSLAGGVMTDWFGYSTTMWVGAALTASGAVAAWLLLPETLALRKRAHAEHFAVQLPPVTAPGTSAATAVAEGRWHANGALWFAVSLYALGRFVIAGVIAATLALLVEESFGPATLAWGVASLTGILMAGRTLVSMASAPLAGALSDRTGNRGAVCIWGLAVGAAGMTLMAAKAPVAIVAGLLVVSLSAGSVQALSTTLTGDAVSAIHHGRAIGLLHTVGDLGSALGPSVGYALLPWIGLSGTYLMCAVLFAAALLGAARFYTHQQGPIPASHPHQAIEDAR